MRPCPAEVPVEKRAALELEALVADQLLERSELLVREALRRLAEVDRHLAAVRARWAVLDPSCAIADHPGG